MILHFGGYCLNYITVSCMNYTSFHTVFDTHRFLNKFKLAMHGRDDKHVRLRPMPRSRDVALSAQGSGICNPFASKQTCQLNLDRHDCICVT
jgi:hypothetical protein